MSRSLTKLFTILVLVGAMATATFAQDDMTRPITKSGSAAWQFSINGLGDFGIIGVPIATVPNPDPGTNSLISSMTIYGVGFKTFISDMLALRGRIGIGMASSSQTTPSGDDKESLTAFGIGVGVESHTGPLYSTSPYFGGEVTFGTASFSSTPAGGTESSSSGTSIGVRAFGGFDWFFTKGLAVGAEAGIGFATGSSTSKAGGTSSDGPSTTMITTSAGNVHLTVFF